MLRIKIELVPHGDESRVKVLDEVFVGNDGTGERGGPNSGGVGNYDVYETDPREDRDRHIGRIEGIERTPEHRVLLARKALELLEKERGIG